LAPAEGLHGQEPVANRTFARASRINWPPLGCEHIGCGHKGYPEEYEDELPANSNTATYAERGWTFVETSWACMAKGRGFSDAGPSQVWDLGKLDTTESSWYEMRDKCTKDKVDLPTIYLKGQGAAATAHAR